MDIIALLVVPWSFFFSINIHKPRGCAQRVNFFVVRIPVRVGFTLEESCKIIIISIIVLHVTCCDPQLIPPVNWELVAWHE